jgi:Fe2+ transport system protein FeoA
LGKIDVLSNFVLDKIFKENRQKMVKLLSEFVLGDKGKIVKVNGEGKVRRRLFDMGVTPGAEVEFRKKAPLGDPVEVTIRGYELTLRKVEAECVEVEVQK